jgi:uncharacterized protein
VEMAGQMHLTALEEDQTRMDWKATVTVSGTIASVGARLLQSVADKLTQQFFACLKSRLNPETAKVNG